MISNACQGDAAAWERVVGLYQEPVFRLAYLILGEVTEAEDVAQETFIRAFLKLDRFDKERPLRPWLLSIVANLARNRRRSIGRYWAALQRLWQSESPKEAAASAEAVDPAIAIEAEQLWQAVQQLRPISQEIVYLRYFLALSESETAITLKIAPGTAKSRLHRALKQLRAVIEMDYPELWTRWND